MSAFGSDLATRSDVLRRYQSGATYNDIAVDYGVSSRTVATVIKTYGKPRPTGHPRYLTADSVPERIKQQIHRLYDDGYPPFEIAYRSKVATYLVNDILQECY